MRCPHCGNQVPDTARACGHCGQWLVVQPATPHPAAASPKRGLPGWAIALIGGLTLAAVVAIIVVIVLLSGRSGGSSLAPTTAAPDVSTATAKPTDMPSPTQTPVSAGTPARAVPVVENVPEINRPPSPFGLKMTCLQGPDTLEGSSACPVIKWDGYTYWAYSHHDNRFAMTIVAYDAAGNVVQQWYRTGARYIVQIAVDAVAETVTFLGQDNETIVMTWDELRVTASTEGPPETVSVGLNAGEEQVLANTPVVLSIAWVADTSEQVADWLVAVDLTVTLDGISLRNTKDYWGEIEEYRDIDEDGDMDYTSRWRYPVGVLSPGTHSAEIEYRLQQPVTDGFDDDGDGTLDEYYEPWGYSLQIIVEE